MRTKDGFQFQVPVPTRRSYSSRLLGGTLRRHYNDLKIRTALAEALIESVEEILRSRQEREDAERES